MPGTGGLDVQPCHADAGLPGHPGRRHRQRGRDDLPRRLLAARLQQSGRRTEAAGRVRDSPKERNGAGMRGSGAGPRGCQKTCCDQPAGNAGGLPAEFDRFHDYPLIVSVAQRQAATENRHSEGPRIHAWAIFIIATVSEHS
ncbi:hypothetical protein CNECB9_420004 [Cupriavidus necator]|uniref:Uncharacterized protein n=1 Tax=Cupriavidus necator TaxID=106590 RepID=A0A1K0JJ35_CUPNE|nr:hypothetical protein CNECB9_420004 [Cupriavidus necator]